MSLKLTKQEIVSLFNAQKAGLITSDTLQKIILSASQGNMGGYEEAPKQTWQGQDIYSMDGNTLCRMVLAEATKVLRNYSPTNHSKRNRLIIYTDT